MDAKTKTRLQSRPPRHSLKERLHSALVGLGLGLAALGTLAYGITDSLQRRNSQLRESEALSRGISANLAKTGLSLNWALELPYHDRILYGFLFDAEGRMHSRYDRGIAPGTLGSPELPLDAWNQNPIEVPVVIGGAKLGSLRLVVDTTPTSDQFWQYLLAFASSACATFFLSRFIARRLHRRISTSLLDLTHTANAISARQDYSIRALVRSNDEIGLLVEIFNHMIEQVQLREHRLSRAVTRAEEAKLAKSQFLATMSHEIRTPINGILGMTQLLWDTKLSDEQIDFAKTIDQSARGLLRIINDILEFSKGEAKRYSLEQIPFSLQEVIGECLATTATLAFEKNLELTGFANKSVPNTLRGDPARLRQVILNLISNALKFTQRGEVQVRARLLEDHGATVSIAVVVSDTGIGIPADRIDRLYKCFSQVDSSNHRKFGGTGLGLAISHQIITAMGGEMTLSTEEGKGSAFGFKLKLPKGVDLEVPSVPTPKGMRILAIENSAGIRESLLELLGGNRVQFCSTGLEGRRHLREAKPNDLDLVILDERLAEGMATNEHDQELVFPSIPLILITPINHNSATQTIDWPGKVACMTRPINPSDLYWCVSSLRNDAAPSLQRRLSATPKQEKRQLSFALNILVVEDHPVNQRITTRFLEKIGARWSLANNGREAVAAFQTGVFDVILMDVQMPVMDGIEATRAIRELESEGRSRIPIVAMTASVLEEDEQERKAAGFDDFVPKPVHLDELNECLQRWIHSRIPDSRLAA